MKRSLFYFLIALGVLLGSVLLTIVLFMSIDINSYKSEIESLVLKKTGRTLHIEGDIERSLFPWLGVSIGAAHLSNAPNFDAQDFARISGADIRVKVPPLFYGALEVDVLTLKGLKLNLARNSDGVTNWADMLAAAETPNKTPAEHMPANTEVKDAPPPKAMLSGFGDAFSLGGIQLQNAQFSWQDELANQSFHLSQVNWEVSEIKADTPIVYQLDLEFDSTSPEIAGRLSSKGALRAELKREYYQLSSFILELKSQGEKLPGKGLHINLATDINLDYKNQKLDVNTFTLKGLGLVVSASLKGKNILAAPTLESQIKMEVTDAKKLHDSLVVTLPEIALSIQPGLLKRATVFSRFSLAVESGDLAIDALDVDVNAAQIRLRSQWDVKNVANSPKYKGSLQLEKFNPSNLMNELGIDVPKTNDSNVLQNAALSLKVSGDDHNIRVTDLSAKLDKTQIEADVEVNNFSAPSIKLSVEVDRLNLDHYLPPAATSADSGLGSNNGGAAKSNIAVTGHSTTSHASIDATSIATNNALAPLRDLNLQAKVFVKALTVANAKLQYIDAKVMAKKGIVRISPLKFNLYDGATLTDIKLNVLGSEPKFFIKNTSTTIAIGPLLRDVYGDDVVSGAATMQLDLTAQGMDADAIIQTLNGKGNFIIDEGVLDVDLETYLNDTYQQYKKLTKNPRKNIKKSAFEKISASYILRDGVLSNKDLKGNLRRYRINGRGKIDLPKQQIDYILDTTVVKVSDANKKDQSVSELGGHTIPIKIRGSLSDPSIKPDYSAVAKVEVKKALKKEQRKLEEKADKAIDKEVDKLEKKYDIKLDKLKNKLKDLF